MSRDRVMQELSESQLLMLCKDIYNWENEYKTQNVDKGTFFYSMFQEYKNEFSNDITLFKDAVLRSSTERLGKVIKIIMQTNMSMLLR